MGTAHACPSTGCLPFCLPPAWRRRRRGRHRAGNLFTRLETSQAIRLHAPFASWLLSIAANLSSNRRRSVGRYVSALMRAFREQPKESPPETVTAQNAEANELWRAVQQLDLPDQQIIYLRYFLDLAVSETADALQIAEGTVKSRLNRALEKLRKIIHQDFPVLVEGREA